MKGLRHKSEHVRVLIADDSLIARRLLRSYLETDPEISIVGEARNGREAYELAHTRSPDLVIMDLNMPVLSGLDAISEIMERCACPILVVTSSSDAALVGEAIERGALEVVNKPDCTSETATAFAARVRLLASVKVISRRRNYSGSKTPAFCFDKQCQPTVVSNSVADGEIGAIAIAASTGGPQALVEILSSIPQKFTVPIVIAQHISAGFAEGMAAWLGSICRLPVLIANSGEQIQRGNVYLARPECDLIVTRTRNFKWINPISDGFYHPNCNVLLNSIAEVFHSKCIGVILSGMGSDGAHGLLKIHDSGGMTIAQDESSSIVFGMNAVAISLGAADLVLPCNEIGPALVRMADLAAR